MSSSRPQADCTAPGPYGSLMEITRRPPITFTRGQGGRLWDSDGHRYLDFVQGWAVNCLGHAPPALTRVLAEQSARLLTCSPAYYSEPTIRYADALTAAAGLDRVFFANSGAEANEGAIKLARKWGARHRDGAYEIVTVVDGFHGRTLATMSASGKAAWEQLFEPKVAGFPKVPLNDIGGRRGRDHGAHRRHHAGADPGRVRRPAGRRRVSEIPALAGGRAGTAADSGRDPDRHGTDRCPVLLRAQRRATGYPDTRQGDRRGDSAGGIARTGRGLLFRARRPGRHLQRQRPDGCRRPCGARPAHRGGLPRTRPRGGGDAAARPGGPQRGNTASAACARRGSAARPRPDAAVRRIRPRREGAGARACC